MKRCFGLGVFFITIVGGSFEGQAWKQKDKEETASSSKSSVSQRFHNIQKQKKRNFTDRWDDDFPSSFPSSVGFSKTTQQAHQFFSFLEFPLDNFQFDQTLYDQNGMMNYDKKGNMIVYEMDEAESKDAVPSFLRKYYFDVFKDEKLYSQKELNEKNNFEDKTFFQTKETLVKIEEKINFFLKEYEEMFHFFYDTCEHFESQIKQWYNSEKPLKKFEKLKTKYLDIRLEELMNLKKNQKDLEARIANKEYVYDIFSANSIEEDQEVRLSQNA